MTFMHFMGQVQTGECSSYFASECMAIKQLRDVVVVAAADISLE